jgi:hypothetical protein
MERDGFRPARAVEPSSGIVQSGGAVMMRAMHSNFEGRRRIVVGSRLIGMVLCGMHRLPDMRSRGIRMCHCSQQQRQHQDSDRGSFFAIASSSKL